MRGMAFSFLAAWRYGLAALVVVCSLATGAAAQISRITPQGVPYLTGGVGSDERAAMAQMAGGYSLKLEFARSDRAYLGDVAVRITGPVATNLVAEGPILYLRLPPGDYVVTADNAGAARTRRVRVGATGQASAAFLW